MAADIKITDGELHIDIKGFDKLFSLKSHIHVPLKHVKSVKQDADTAGNWLSGVKVKGGRIPGVMKAGTFLSEGKKVFWDVHHADKAIVIELQEETYATIVIEVNDPAVTVKLIEDALASTGTQVS